MSFFAIKSLTTTEAKLSGEILEKLERRALGSVIPECCCRGSNELATCGTKSAFSSRPTDSPAGMAGMSNRRDERECLRSVQ